MGTNSDERSKLTAPIEYQCLSALIRNFSFMPKLPWILAVAGFVVSSLALRAEWPRRVFAPYMYLGAKDKFQLTQCDDACGQKFYTLAFVIAGPHDEAAWDGKWPTTDHLYADQIAAIRERGGDVIVSF